MKKCFCLFMAMAMMALCFVGCGDAEETTTPDVESASSVVSEEVPSVDAVSSEQAVSSEEEVSSEETPEWKTFITEYEAFIDDFVALTEQYNADPTDLTLMEDYTEMAQEANDWVTRAQDLQDDLAADPEALQEFIDMLDRVTEKLSAVLQ